MDNRNRAPKFYGTPLSKVLNDDESASKADIGPINRRRARLERAQIATDDQGRRRFHGAFTGGFSAGYHNTVDTVQGFQPKSFTSKRGVKHQDEAGSSTFEHRPEDYMDEEDFGEFGIAPKKIRLAGQFSETSSSKGGQSLVVNDSIGEKILRCMTGNRRVNECLEQDRPRKPKNDFHGLGYKPLKVNHSDLREEHLPQAQLVATVKSGMRLRIAGQAFGVGVLDDEDNNLSTTNEYGYDDIANYEFAQASATKKASKQPPDERRLDSRDLDDTDPYLLPGFERAQDDDALQSCDNECLKYPLPIIEDGWQIPTRKEPLIKPREESDLHRKNIDSYKSRISSFNDKFTHGESGTSKMSSVIEARSGLVPYSDLKTFASTKSQPEAAKALCSTEETITITRRVVEWRPCSLLCKHFGVDNPFPDNKFCGVRPADLAHESDILENLQMKERDEPIMEIAPLELRKSIFNVCFDDLHEPEAVQQDRNTYADEDLPQIINLESPEEIECLEGISRDRDPHQAEPDPSIEPEIVVMEVPKRQPEVIVLSSSEESKSGNTTPVNVSDDDDDDDDDAYGPPLPPSRRTLDAVQRFRPSRDCSNSSSSKSHKHPKEKSHKSKKSKRHKVRN